MPFTLVFTREGCSDAVTAVPSAWVQNSYLLWPRLLKKNEIEALRSNEESIPGENWKKMKCKTKLAQIQTFKEALALEDIYSKFDDTEDEERYFKDCNNSNPNIKIIKQQLTNVNTDMLNANNTIYLNTRDLENTTERNTEKYTEKNSEGDTKRNSDQDNTSIVSTTDLLKIVEENNSLIGKNKKLQEDIVQLLKTKNENTSRYAAIQIQLDKIIDLLHGIQDVRRSDACFNSTEKEFFENFNFPIQSKEELDLLELKLHDEQFENYLIDKFSKITGTSGLLKIGKFGLQLFQHMVKDELLNQYTWKGIKGCPKVAFIKYVKIRELFYKIVNLADKSCSMKESDAYIQNSVIKHSGQRVKRKLVGEEKHTDMKKNKSVDDRENQHLFICPEIGYEEENNYYCNQANSTVIGDEENTLDPLNAKVTLLSKVKITNKILDRNDVLKNSNISSPDLRFPNVVRK